MRNLFTWAAARLVAVFALTLPLAAMALTSTASTYSTYSNDTATPSAGGAYSNHQRFQLNASWMFPADGTDIAASVAAVNVESIEVKWPGSGHQNADIGHNRGGEQPDAYLVLTTPQDVIVGISSVNDVKWVADGTSTFEFTDVVISPNAQYYFYFATDVSGLSVGAVMPSANKKVGRVLCAWHGSGHSADETVRIGASNEYSINCNFVVSEASAVTVTTEAEAVDLSTDSYPVIVTGAVANGVVNVASGATYPSLTVVGEATTLKLADSIAATYLYLPATTTIDASAVSFALPSGDATTAETVLVSGKISSASDPAVTLPTLDAGYAFEPVVYNDTGIKVIVSKPVDATVVLNGTEQKWSEVKPEGWVNSAVPVIYVDNSIAGTLVFDEDVQAAKIRTTATTGAQAVNFVRSNNANVAIALFESASTYMRITFTNFDAIPQTNHQTDSTDQITVAGSSTLTSFPQIGTANQGAKLVLDQPATFTGNGIYVIGSKDIDVNSGAAISTTRLVLGNERNTTQTVIQNGGTVTITGADGAGSTSASVLLGHWNSTSTFKTLGGTFTANNAASRLGWDGTTTWQIGGGESAATVNVYGIVNGQNGHSGFGTLNIMGNGTLNLGAGGIQFSNSGNDGKINLAGGTVDTGAASVTIANAKDAGTVLNQNKTTVFNVDTGKTLTVDAVISGEGVGTLNKTGAGKLVLAKTATAKGKLVVSAGTVEFNEGISWGPNGSVEVAENGTLNVLTAEKVSEGSLLVAGTFTVNGTVLNNGDEIVANVKSDGIYVAPSTVTITVPVVGNTTVTVTADGNPVDPVSQGGNAYDVDFGAPVVVVYAVDPDAYEIVNGTIEFTATEDTEVTAPTVTPYVAWIYDGNDEIIGRFKQPTPAVIAFCNGTGEKARFAEALSEAQHNQLAAGSTYDSTTITYTRLPTVAVIVSQSGVWTNKYASIAAAVSAASEGAVITLVDNVALSESVEVAAGKSISLDLGGKTITGPAGGYAFSNAGTVAISGGTITGAGGIVTNTADGASIVISSGTYTATGDLFGNVEGGTIAVSGGTFNQSVADEYIAKGYEVKDNGDGTYGIRIDMGWIYEADGYKEYTGTWSNEVEYVNGKAHIEDGNTYTASRPSDGRMVTVEMTLSFDDVNDEDETVGDAKAAVKLATGGFKVYTSDGPDGAVTSVWKSVAIDGLDLKPQANEDYTFLFVLDLTNTTYTAALITGDGAATNALVLADGSVANIPFASRGNVAPVQKIEFIGAGSVTSIEGSYEDAPAPVNVFVEDEPITLTDGSVSLSADQAAWLNKLGAKSAVATRLGQLASAQFSAAYLLNLDLMGDFTYEFKVTDITVGDSSVEVEVTLTRTGTYVDGEYAINGTLTLKGTAAIGTPFETIGDAALGFDRNNNFCEESPTSASIVTIDTSKTGAKFYKPVIE